jgi:hypothetical protein
MAEIETSLGNAVSFREASDDFALECYIKVRILKQRVGRNPRFPRRNSPAYQISYAPAMGLAEKNYADGLSREEEAYR